MKRNKKRGFTLIEAVICIALIALITAGFLSMALTNLSITEKMNEYAQKTSDLVSAYETNNKFPVSDIKREERSGTGSVPVDDDHSDANFNLTKGELSDADHKMTYYHYEKSTARGGS